MGEQSEGSFFTESPVRVDQRMNRSQKEALLELLAHAFESDEQIGGLVYLDIQKIFYHLQERLQDDNEIKDLLPYYWYLDGTVSDTVQQTVDYGLETGALDEDPTTRTGSGVWYQSTQDYAPEAESISAEDMETAKLEIERVLDEDYEVTENHEEKIEDIYEEAPYDFQRCFKLNVLFAVDQFASGRPLYLGIENLASEIRAAEAYLPLDPAFEEFNTVFSRYVNTSNRYFELVDNDTRVFAERFKQLSESIWQLFCDQLRLQAHDPYYQSKVDEWEKQYERSRQLLANDLIEFRRLLDTEFEEERETQRVPEESSWGKMAADYLDG